MRKTLAQLAPRRGWTREASGGKRAKNPPVVTPGASRIVLSRGHCCIRGGDNYAVRLSVRWWGEQAELEPSCSAKKKRWRGRENATPTWVVRVAPIGTVDAPASGLRIRCASWCCQTRRESAISGRLAVLLSKQPRSRRKRIVAVVRSGQHQQCASLLRIESIVLSVTRAEILPRDGAVVCRSAEAYDSRAKSEG